MFTIFWGLFWFLLIFKAIEWWIQTDRDAYPYKTMEERNRAEGLALYERDRQLAIIRGKANGQLPADYVDTGFAQITRDEHGRYTW